MKIVRTHQNPNPRVEFGQIPSTTVFTGIFRGVVGTWLKPRLTDSRQLIELTTSTAFINCTSDEPIKDFIAYPDAAVHLGEPAQTP